MKKFIETMKSKLQSKKIDPISMALVGLLGISAVFSAVMISSSNGLENQTILPPVVENDDLSEETVKTSSKANDSEKVMLPLASENPKVVVSYLATNAEDLSQPMYKMIKQGDSYYTSESTGVTYQTENNDVVNVVAALSGTVESIQEDLISGTIVTVLHENNIRTTYVGVQGVVVGVDAELNQGDIIGKTGVSQLSTGDTNVIHFEITKDDTSINPEEALNKSVNEL